MGPERAQKRKTITLATPVMILDLIIIAAVVITLAHH